MKSWKFALSTADTAPATAPILLRGDICDNLVLASRLGYQGIEIHTRETARVDYDKVMETCLATGCKVSMIITGRICTEGRVNLIDDRPYITDVAMAGMLQYVDMAERLEAGIVIGWVRGSVPAGGDLYRYRTRLAENLAVIAEYAAERGVPVALEVINRYELNICTSAKETMDFLEEYGLETIQIHLDTFHMNIDETDPYEAIRLCSDRLGYFHLADNSRRYPGSGQLDFKKILSTLQQIGYDGYLSVECFPYPDGETAARRALQHIQNCMSQL